MKVTIDDRTAFVVNCLNAIVTLVIPNTKHREKKIKSITFYFQGFVWINSQNFKTINHIVKFSRLKEKS